MTKVYVDDRALTLIGARAALSWLHPWACRLLLRWIRNVLCKRVAPGKAHCTTSSCDLKTILTRELRDEEIEVSLSGELLGIDVATGRQIRYRRSAATRRRKCVGRLAKLLWLKRKGGRRQAKQVARGGLKLAACYGEAIHGITNATLYTIRRAQAATCRVTCGGSSATACLATGGEHFAEADPAILDANPPLLEVHSRVWDRPTARQELVKMWRQAQDEVGGAAIGNMWSKVRGSVGAALAHLRRVGAAWPKPFTIHALHHDINLLEVPPLQVRDILRRHARIHYDRMLLHRLSGQYGWDATAVDRRYKHGIDWPLIRDTLNGKVGNLVPAERAALLVLTCNGYWPTARRWRAGYEGHGTCEACLEEVGEAHHCLHKCGALLGEKTLHRWSGHLGPMTQSSDDAALMPLMTCGLPPMPAALEPTEPNLQEGELPPHFDGESFGDGSGVHQEHAETRIATWAVVRLAADGESAGHTARGRVGGWFPTVPRAELLAYIHHLQHAMIPGRYVGDCQQVIDAGNLGVSAQQRSSSSYHADFWKEAYWLQQDHGPGLRSCKTKAHRARAAAELSASDPIRWWTGNAHADDAAKSLARSIACAESKMTLIEDMRKLCSATLHHVAFAAAWAMRCWPASRHTSVTNRRRVWHQPPVPNADGKFERAGHLLTEYEHRAWACETCNLRARGGQGWRALARRPCRGPPAAQAHPSHDIRLLGSITWCNSCGAFAVRWPRGLRIPCPRQPQSAAQRHVLHRLRLGMPPTTAGYLKGSTERVMDPIVRDGRRSRPEPHRGNGTKVVSCGRYLRLPGGPLYRGPSDHRQQAVLHPSVSDHHPASFDDGGDVAINGNDHEPRGPPRELDMNTRYMRHEGRDGFQILLGAHDGVTVEDVAAPPSGHTGTDSDVVQMGGAEADSGNGSAAADLDTSIRRRLRGKQGDHRRMRAASHAAEMRPNNTDAVPRLCGANLPQSWSGRLKCFPMASPAPCHLCQTLCRAQCRGCRRGLCVQCAKERLGCRRVIPVNG